MVRQKGQSCNQPGEDVSVLRQPITLGTSGTMQVVQALRSGTTEVQQVLLQECDLIFECKVCKNLFRGLPNMLAHKRVYCKEKYAEKEIFTKQMTDAMIHSQQDETVLVQPEPPPKSPAPDPLQSDPEEDPWNNQYPDETPSDNKYKANAKNCNAKSKSKSDITSVVEKMKQGKFKGQSKEYQFYTAATALSEIKQEQKSSSEVQLSSMEGTSCAVLQRVRQLRREENTESEEDSSNGESKQFKKRGRKRKRSQVDSNDAASESSAEPDECVIVEPVEPKGSLRMCLRDRAVDQGVAAPVYETLLRNPKCDVKKLSCLLCKTTYRSIKTLHFHMSSFHSEKRTFYPCLYCSAIFAQLYSVTRHLIKNHGKTKAQVEKMREQLKKKAFNRLVDDFGAEKYLVKPKEECYEDGHVKSEGAEEKSSDQTDKSTMPGLGMGLTLQRCRQCPKAFATKESLDAHVARAHEEELSTVPDDSASASSISTRRSSRQAEKHTDESTKNVKTEPGDEEESPILKGISASELRKMAGFIDETTKKCLKCKKRYGSLSNLQRHAVRHLGWRRFKCKMCRYTAYNRSECRTHIRKVHSYKVNNLHNYDLAKFIIELDDDTVDMQRTRVPRVDMVTKTKSSKAPYDRFPTFTSAFKYYNINTRKNARRVTPMSQDLQTLRTRSGVYTKPSFEELTGRGKDSEESGSSGEEEEQQIMEEGQESEEDTEEIKEGKNDPDVTGKQETDQICDKTSPGLLRSDMEAKSDIGYKSCQENPCQASEQVAKSSAQVLEGNPERCSEASEPHSNNPSQGLKPESEHPSHLSEPETSCEVSEPKSTCQVSELNSDSDAEFGDRKKTQIDIPNMAAGEQVPVLVPSTNCGMVALGKTVQSVDKAVTKVVTALQQQTASPKADNKPLSTVSANLTRCRPIILSQQPQMSKVKVIPAGVPVRPIVVTSSQLRRIIDMKKKAQNQISSDTTASSMLSESTQVPMETTSQGSQSKGVQIPGIFVSTAQTEVSRSSPILSSVHWQTTCSLVSTNVTTQSSVLPMNAPLGSSADSDTSSPKVVVSVAEHEEEHSQESSDESRSSTPAHIAEHRLTEGLGVRANSPQLEVSISVQGRDTGCLPKGMAGEVTEHGEQAILQHTTSIVSNSLKIGKSDNRGDGVTKVVETADMPQLAPIPVFSSSNKHVADTTEMPTLCLATEPRKGTSKEPVHHEVFVPNPVLALDSPPLEDSPPLTPDSLAPSDASVVDSDVDQHSDSTYTSDTVNPTPSSELSDPVLTEKQITKSPCGLCDVVKESQSPLTLLQADLNSPAPSPQAGISSLSPLDIGLTNTPTDTQGGGDGLLNTKTDVCTKDVPSDSSEYILDFIDRTEAGLSNNAVDPMRFINS